ncbi:MAG: ATP-dependent DNA helicase RecG [Mucinivorans sp.]
MAILDQEIKYLPTVGQKRAAILRSELGVITFGDMLLHTPFRYIDRSKFFTLRELTHSSVQSEVQIRARVQQVQMVGQGNKARLVVTVFDGTGHAELVWFRSTSWVLKSLDREREYVFFGRAEIFNGNLEMVHPEFEPVGLTTGAVASGIVGVYPLTEKMRSAMIGTRAVATIIRLLWDKVEGQIPETLPGEVLLSTRIMDRAQALHQVHFPTSEAKLSEAIYRLKFEELFIVQLDLLQQKLVRTQRSSGFVFEVVGENFNKFYKEILPFQLTRAQKQVLREIRADVRSTHQMNRLLQGDVGSGKTIVAFMASLLAIDNGYQVAFMAPTEILASQHMNSISELCIKLGLRAELLTGSTRKKAREKLLDELADGQINILIGTHALIEDPVIFSNLGFVVIDEQHRFGVLQRARLHAKAGVIPPHVLVMSATPIPRTLSMTLYGDLDVSVIDELPPGRVPIRTIHAKEERRLRVYGFLREQIALGRQVYIVYPLIEENAKIDLLSLEQGAAAVADAFPPAKGYCSVVVHGKMSQREKAFGMELFKKGVAQILIATTVIEVGVDVPNATVMLIENAERFGLSQLHQLRGRVGRGADQAYCILLSGDKIGADARRRLETMVATTDGFAIAQADMELRGAGDIDGTRQSGQAIEIRFADLAHDGAILERARASAEQLLAKDPQLQSPDNFELRVILNRLRTNTGAEQFDLSTIS